MVGLLDPPRPGVRDAVSTLLDSGVQVKMLTGDAKETALTIGNFFQNLNSISFVLVLTTFFSVVLFPAEILGLHTKGRLALSGEELEALDSFQLGDAVDQVHYHTANLALN